MGMYDTLQWDYFLPEDEHVGRQYQTKDFDCTLSHYRVDSEGNLLVKLVTGERTPTLALYNCTYEWDYYKVDAIIRFYEYHEDEWIEYMAEFKDGKVIFVIRLMDINI